MTLPPLYRHQRVIDGQVMTIQQRYNTCGRKDCRCAISKEYRHGPYFYGYRYEAGKLKSKYIGKQLPAEEVER